MMGEQVMRFEAQELPGQGTLPADQYQYELSYTRSGESTPYAQGSGVLTLNTAKAAGSQGALNIVRPE